MPATSHTSNSDKQLLAAMQGGGRDALQELYRRYAPMLLGFISRLVDEKTAAEVLQNLFIEVWVKRSEYGACEAHLFATLLHRARQLALATKVFKQNITHKEIRNSNIYVSTIGALEKTFPPAGDLHAAVFDLVYIDGYNVGEVAERIDVTTGDVKKMLRCAMSKFKVVQHG